MSGALGNAKVRNRKTQSKESLTPLLYTATVGFFEVSRSICSKDDGDRGTAKNFLIIFYLEHVLLYFFKYLNRAQGGLLIVYSPDH